MLGPLPQPHNVSKALVALPIAHRIRLFAISQKPISLNHLSKITPHSPYGPKPHYNSPLKISTRENFPHNKGRSINPSPLINQNNSYMMKTMKASLHWDYFESLIQYPILIKEVIHPGNKPCSYYLI